MTGMPLLLAGLLVALGGAVGAALRHLASARPLGSFLGVLLVNVLGSLALGVLVGAGELVPAWVVLLVGTGLCGALTTWSTLAVQTWELGRRAWRRAAAYLGVTLLLGLGAAVLGYALATVLL